MTADTPQAQRHFAFVRAINVGKRRLTNDELLEPFRQVGLDDVAAYQAAGNVTFRTSDPEAVESGRLGDILSAAYGFDTSVFVRSRAELGDTVQAKPFTAEQLASTEGRVQAAFLDRSPAEAVIDAVMALVPPEDLVVFSGREWVWLPRRGISDSRLRVPKIEELVGPTTLRTMGTLARMLERFS